MKLEDLKKAVATAAAKRIEKGAARYTVVVGMGTCGIAAGAREVLAALIHELEARGIADVIVTQVGCRGLCEREPLVYIQAPGGEEVVYAEMTPSRVREVIASHIAAGQPVAAYVLPAAERPAARQKNA